MRSIHQLRPVVLVGALACLPAVASAAEPPRVDRRVAAAATDAESTLRRALERLRAGAPTRADVRRAQRAMAAIHRAVDAYFHAPNLRDPAARGPVAELRRHVHRLLWGADALLVLHDDVIRFRPAVHRELAAACAEIGDRRGQIRHLRAAIAVEGPTLADLAILRAAHLALGETAAAEAVAAEIAALRTAALDR